MSAKKQQRKTRTAAKEKGIVQEKPVAQDQTHEKSRNETSKNTRSGGETRDNELQMESGTEIMDVNMLLSTSEASVWVNEVLDTSVTASDASPMSITSPLRNNALMAITSPQGTLDVDLDDFVPLTPEEIKGKSDEERNVYWRTYRRWMRKCDDALFLKAADADPVCFALENLPSGKIRVVESLIPRWSKSSEVVEIPCVSWLDERYAMLNRGLIHAIRCDVTPMTQLMAQLIPRSSYVQLQNDGSRVVDILDQHASLYPRPSTAHGVFLKEMVETLDKCGFMPSVIDQIWARILNLYDNDELARPMIPSLTAYIESRRPRLKEITSNVCKRKVNWDEERKRMAEQLKMPLSELQKKPNARTDKRTRIY